MTTLPISNFDIRNSRAIRRAACDDVPSVMLIAGPNGCGKTTLLDNLRRQHQRQNVLYVGPHRDPQPQQVNLRNLFGTSFSVANVLQGDNLPGVSGVQLPGRGRNRDPWGIDGAFNYLKHGIARIEEDRKDAIAERFDRNGAVSEDDIPDIWQPLRELTESLLPHLRFNGVNDDNESNVQCEWKIHGNGATVDINNLSSGERSVLQLFFPLVEHRIRAQLDEVRGETGTQTASPAALIIDEPELHLHPQLQTKVLDYFRELAASESMQFIAATQSATMVDYATNDELFVLKPPDLVSNGANQLTQIAEDEDALTHLREVFAGTSNITSLQPIIVVEGIPESQASNVVTDRKLYHQLFHAFDQVNLVPGGSKTQCQRLVGSIRELYESLNADISAIALVDRDLQDTPDERSDLVRLLPVAMVENFLLDSDAIYESIQSVIEDTELSNRTDTEDAIDRILDGMRRHEIERRVKEYLGTAFFRPTSPVDDIEEQFDEFVSDARERFSAASVETVLSQSEAEVERIIDEGDRKRLYDGKEAINRFFSQHLHATGMKKEIFKFEVARHLDLSEEHVSFFREMFGELGVTSQT